MKDADQGSDSILNSYFAEKVCINLARRTDRWFHVQEQFRLHGLTSVHRFDAFDGSAATLPGGWDYGPGSYGCLRSHTSVVRAALDHGSPSVLILEDDVVFHPDPDAMFRKCAPQIPADWDALLFGGLHRTPPEPVSPNIARLKETSSTYAYAVRNTLYDAFLDINRDTMIAVDENNHILQRNFNFYCFMPHLAWVTRDYSDIMEGEVNPWWLRDSIVLFGPEQDRTFREMGVAIFFDSDGFTNPSEAAQQMEFLRSALRLYMEVVEESAICIVERAAQPLLTAANLPQQCHYCLFPPATSAAHCARRVVGALGSKRYFVCAPHDIYPLRSELRATLLCCPHYDIVSPLHEPLRIDAEDTAKVLRDDVGAINTARYRPLPADPLTAGFCVIAAPLLREISNSCDQMEILTPSLLERSRVFRSPSRLLRLSGFSKAVVQAGD
jgi:glycosyl transferase family 25